MPTLVRRLLPLTLMLPLAAAADVLLERVTWPGFVMEGYAASTACTIDSGGQLRQTFQLAELKSSRSQQTQLTVAPLKAAIAEAALGKVASEIFPVDAPTTIYRAYRRGADGRPRPIVLLEENGGSGEKKVNQSPAAIKLKNFIDLNCSGAIQF
jgi:hypothetical protein